MSKPAASLHPSAAPSPDKSFILSTVARKFIISFSGLGLVVFVILHLLGNLALYRTDQGAHFNAYAHMLESWGGVLVAAELGLLAVFLVHIGWALYSKTRNLAARGQGYRTWRSKGGGTPSNLSSRSMAISGMLILAFVILHVWQFRFGSPELTQDESGQQIRNLYQLVVETFKNPVWAGVYLVSMVLLGIHLRHGIWSGFQSLGLTSPRCNRQFRLACAFLGVILAIGFFFIPVWIYLQA